MKALSVKQPWAELIVCGKKLVENRSWETHYRGPLVIHAGKSKSCLREYDTDPADWTLGALVGQVQLVDCVPYDCLPARLRRHKFAEGPWCWIVADAVRFEEPLPWPGQLRLFDVDVEVELVG